MSTMLREEHERMIIARAEKFADYIENGVQEDA